MNTLTARIVAARDLSAKRAGDIRLKEFFAAMTIWPDVRSHGDPSSVMIGCHFKSWHRYFMPPELAAMRHMSDDELELEVAGWLQDSILTHPPKFIMFVQ